MRKRGIAVLGLAFVAASAACSPSEDPDTEGPMAVAGTFPLFEGLGKGMKELSDARPAGQRSQAPEAIDWAPNIYAAIEQATAENKPIFVSVHVRENADPTGDV